MQFSLSKAQKSVAGKQPSSKAELSLFPRPREESKHTLGEPGPTPEGIFDMQTTANFLKENLREKKKKIQRVVNGPGVGSLYVNSR